MNEKVSSSYYKICPKCKYFCHTAEADEFCSLCGSKLIDMCPGCGKTIDNPYAKFCKYCGNNYPGKLKDENVKPF